MTTNPTRSGGDGPATFKWADRFQHEADVYVEGKYLGRWVEIRGLMEDPDDICDTINRALSPLVARSKLAERMAEANHCPNCPNRGFTVREIGGCDFDGENDTRECLQEQCQWCYETPDSFFNVRAEWDALPKEPQDSREGDK